MSRTGFTVIGLLAICLALPAFSQTTTNDCTGQPTINGSTSGDIAPFTAFPGFETDSFNTSQGNCRSGPATQIDSVWCFTPTDDCTPTFELTGATGTESFIINLVSGSCTTTPDAAACIASVAAPSQGADALLDGQPLTGGTQYCIVGITSLTTFSVAQFSFTDGASSCGALPVEIQRFTVDSSGAESP